MPFRTISKPFNSFNEQDYLNIAEKPPELYNGNIVKVVVFEYRICQLCLIFLHLLTKSVVLEMREI